MTASATAAVDAIPALPQLIRSIKAEGRPLNERKEAVVTLGLLAMTHGKTMRSPSNRALVTRQLVGLWRGKAAAVRKAIDDVPSDRLAREQRDAALAEKALRLRTPAVVAQLISLLTRTRSMTTTVARGLAVYVVPALVAASTPSDEAAAEWAAPLKAAFGAGAEYYDAAAHGPLVVSRLLMALAPAAFGGPDVGAGCPALAAAWLSVFADLSAYVATRCRARSTVAKRNGVAAWPVITRVVSAIPEAAHTKLIEHSSATDATAARGAVMGCVALVAAKRAASVPTAVVSNAFKACPGAFAAAVGAGATVLEDAATVVDAALVAMPIAGLDSVADAGAAIRSAGADAAAIEAVMLDNARVQKMLDPVTKAATSNFTVPNSGAIGDVYGASLPKTATMSTKLLTLAGGMLTSRCNSGPERCVLLRLVAGYLGAQRVEAPAELPAAQAVLAVLKPVIASPVADVFAAAWAIAALLPGELLSGVEPAMAPALKMCAKDEAARRAVFAGAPATYTALNAVAGPFVKDAATTPAFRPEAALAARVPGAVTASKLSAAAVAAGCFTAASLDSISAHFAASPALVDAVFAAAHRLAVDGGAPRGLAFAAAHRSGRLSRAALKAIAADVATSCGQCMTLWESVARDVFGLAAAAADIPPPEADPAAAYAEEDDSATTKLVLPADRGLDKVKSLTNADKVLVASARAILKHHSRVTLSEVVAEVVMCAGSPVICGDESAVMLQPVSAHFGKYAGHGVSSARCQAVVNGIFRAPASAGMPDTLLDAVALAATGAAELLLKHLAETEKATSAIPVTSAINGFAILLSLVPSGTQEQLYALLQQACDAAVKRILSLDALKLALASPNPNEALEHFYVADLTARGLIKNHGPKPPKGMSQDDYEELVHKDDKALKEARVKLIESSVKTGKSIGVAARLYVAPLVAARVAAGFSASLRQQSGAELLIWLQKELGAWTEADKDGKFATPAFVCSYALDAAAALMHTMTGYNVPRNLAELFVHVSAQLQHKTITHLDAAQVNNLALKFRVAGVNALPPQLFPALLPPLKGAFRVVKKAAPQASMTAQHQLMALFAATSGLPGVRGRTAGLDFAVHAITNFGGVYKLAATAMAALAKNATTTEIAPLIRTALCGDTMQREAAATALSTADCVTTHRGTTVAVACLRLDPRMQVSRTAERTIGEAFAFEAGDVEHLIALLRKFCSETHPITVLCGSLKLVLHPETGVAKAAQKEVVDAIKTFDDIYGAVIAFRQLIPVLDVARIIDVLTCLTEVAESPDTDGDAMKELLDCGREALKRVSDADLKKVVAPAVQPKLQDVMAKLSGKGAHTEQLGAVTTAWLTVIATRSNDAAYIAKALEAMPPMLSTAQTATVHYTLAECVADLARHPSMRNSEALVEFGQLCLKNSFNSTSYVKKKAHANAFAGIILGAGLMALRKFDTLAAITDAANDKQAQRSGAMVVIETLAQALGVLFEPYLLVLTQLMLDSIAEKDAKIAECADDAAKAMMSALSDVGLRQLVPRLVDGLRADQNKKKQSSLSLISYIAYCSPRQLAAALPTVVPEVVECLFDANGGTSNAAFTALKRVAGVVANPEIQQHVDSILEAMRNPDTETELCLDALLYSRFNTAIDVASLSLLMPVIIRGLGERESSVRGKAAQIVASLAHLVADPRRALLPYASELLSKLQLTAQDPQAGVRATSAKAMSLLVATLSKEHVDEAIGWCHMVMRRGGTSSAEKCGAAQSLVEIIGVVGGSLLEAEMEELNKGCKDDNAGVREAFMNFFVYAPSALPAEMFTGFLPALFPFVLNGLADATESVRIVALQAGTNVINQHGLNHLDLVLPPLLEGVVSESTSGRQSSLLLASKLLIHIVTEHRRRMRMDMPDSDDEDAEGKDGEDGMGDEPSSSSAAVDNTLRLDSARDAEKGGGMSILGHLEETLGEEGFVRLLSAVHIARSEHNAGVRQEVITAWQVCVASPRTALKKIAHGIVEILVKFASSDRPECVDLAEKCIGYTCQRIHEMIDVFLVAFTKHYAGPTDRHKIGALTCIAETVPCSERERIQLYTPQICSAVLPALRAENEIVRTLAATVSERVTKVVGKSWNDDIVQRQLTVESVVGVVEVVRANTKHSLNIVFKQLIKRDIPTQYDIDLTSELVHLDECATEFVLHYDAICNILCNGIVHGLDGAEDGLTAFAEFIISEDYYPNQFAVFQRLLKTPHTRAAAVKCISAFFRGLSADATEGVILAMRLVLQTFGDVDGTTRDATARAFIAMTQALDEKVAAAKPELDATALRRAAGKYAVQYVETVQSNLLATIHASCGEHDPELPVLRFPKLTDSVLSYYLRALDYGGAVNKLQAVDGIEQVIRHVSATARPMLLNTVMAKCIKALYEKNDGSVVSAVVSLLLHAMTYDTSGKNKILERTIASAVFGATLSESPEARTLGLRLASELLERDTMYADQMLAMAVTKKANLETPGNRAAACRYIALVVRRGNITRPIKNLAALQAIVRPIWDAPDMVLTASASGLAMGAFALSSAMSDEDVGALADEAVRMASANGAQAVGGMACLYTLISAVRSRIDADVVTQAAAAVRAVLPSCGTDRLTALWALRMATLLASIDPALIGKPDAVHALLKRVEVSDDLMMSTAAAAVKVFAEAHPGIADSLLAGKYGESGVWAEVGGFELEFEDEFSSASIMY